MTKINNERIYERIVYRSHRSIWDRVDTGLRKSIGTNNSYNTRNIREKIDELGISDIINTADMVCLYCKKHRYDK